jgi:hypothetical protein
LLTLRVGLLVEIVQVDFVIVLVFKGVKRSVGALFKQKLREVGRGYEVVLLDFVAHLADAAFCVTLTRYHVTRVLGFVVAGQTALLVSGNLRLFGGMQRVTNLVGLLLVACSLCL